MDDHPAGWDADLQVVPTTLAIGDQTLHYNLVVRTGLNDPIAVQIAEGTWRLSSALQWLLASLAPREAVLDLGAHYGSFSIPAGCLGARVTAVEGSGTNATMLRAACDRNALSNIDVVEAVVAGRRGAVEFVDLGPYGTVATEGICQATGYPTVSKVAVCVEDLPNRPFAWAKVDIEGLETAVIRGSSEVFRSVRGMAIESNGYMLNQHGSSPSDLIRAIEKVGMTVYEAQPGILRPVVHPALQPETIVDYVAIRRGTELPTEWKISHSRGRTELLRALDAECRHPIEEHRTYASHTRDRLNWRQRRGLRRL